jgi:hypothetical protein
MSGSPGTRNSGTPASRLQSISIPGPAGRIEGLLQEHDAGTPSFTATVCHPHPLHGGTLHNKVVHRVASVLHGLGAVVLRFNFRGVGKSEGLHDQGEGELEDARAALAWVRGRHPGVAAWVAGFSFGAWVAARLAASEPGVARLVLIAPPVDLYDFSAMRTARLPKVVVQGTADVVCPPQSLEREFPLWSEPRRLVEVEGASHFFDRRLGELAEALHQALAGPAPGSTSSNT